MNGMGVLFDMDGVLVDSYQAHFESWRQMARARGLDMTEQQFASVFGGTSREIVRELWGSLADNEPEVARWDQEKEAAYRDIIARKFPAMDGAPELLIALDQAGFKLAIGSSGPPENVAVVRKCLGKADLFEAQVVGFDVTHGKPHPEVFLKAAAKLRLPANRFAVVEDAPAGVAAGKAAGAAVIAITGTAPREKLKLAAADHVVDSLREITPEIVSQLILKNLGR